MRALARVAVGSACALALLGMPAVAAADHADRPAIKGLTALGHAPFAATFEAPSAQRKVNSDLAFWGNLAYQGNYDGFRVIDISSSTNPVALSHTSCVGDQGDIVVWRNILVRGWNSPAPAGRTCAGQPVPTGFEGVHIFDVSDASAPRLIKAVELECGSHTLTLAGVYGDNIVVWSNNSSSTGCANGSRPADDPAGDFMDIIRIPVAAPQDAYLFRREPLEGPRTNIRTGCHDATVIRGRANIGVCAGADMINVWDIGNNRTAGGSVEDPELLYTIEEPGVGQAETNGRWHSASFTWDGKVMAAGWEPGGGGDAECERLDPAVEKSLFFYSVKNGRKLGQWVLPRAQGANENCTVHNFNIIPLRNGRYVAISGNYQAGTYATDFTNPARPRTVAYSDPAPLPGPYSFCDRDGSAGPLQPECTIGGAWSTYWYNDRLYESDITKGLNVFRLNYRKARNARQLEYLNPQTQQFTMAAVQRRRATRGARPPQALLGSRGSAAGER